MNKKAEGSIIVYTESRRILLAFLVPLPALLVVNHFMEVTHGWVPIAVTTLFAVIGLMLGLTAEKLTLNTTTRMGVYETVFAGVRRRTRTFSFNDVVGCLVLDPLGAQYVAGRPPQSGERTYRVGILYRESNGKLADQIPIGVYITEVEAMTEATALIKALGGQIYFAKDLEKLTA